MAIAKTQKDAGFIEVVNIVSGRTFEPLVQLKWGEKEGQLSVREARDHAARILEVAEAAESDAFVFHWLTRDIIQTEGEKGEAWDRIIQEFKAFREARTKIDGE